MYFTYVLEVHKVGLCKTFPLSIRILERRFEDVRYEGSQQFYFGREEALRCPEHTMKLGSHVGHLGGCHKPRKEATLFGKWTSCQNGAETSCFSEKTGLTDTNRV